jgi:uncharacterized membrane-anchored protein
LVRQHDSLSYFEAIKCLSPRFEKRISVTTVNTPKVEAFYWAAITFSQTLGTALGDWIADSGLGYVGGALVFGIGLSVIAAAYFWTNVLRVRCFGPRLS